ncbi:hypothetical protein FGO68_gene8988 [Halteria grandinella]|uniref:Cadherin domain-containing protein n=1 Tax=Halteria grandinella TaxID=5974 RepID=A0A8J8P4N1_HALGN|nr:hypothetical protein FGO68_gene8988 [Halteria grandinella]
MEISAQHTARTLLVIIILVALLSPSLQSCTLNVQAPFPKLFGGRLGASSLDQIDYDSNYLVAVGSTSDISMSGTAYTAQYQRPIIIAYTSPNFIYAWGKVFDIANQAFYGVEINRHGTKVVASTSSNNLRYLIIFDIISGNILKTISLMTIDNDNKFQRKILLLDTDNILLGDQKNIYKIVPSSPSLLSTAYFTPSNYQTIGLQHSNGETYLHIFSFDHVQSKCLVSLLYTDTFFVIHQQVVECTLSGDYGNFQMGYFRKNGNEDQIAFQQGTKFFRIYTAVSLLAVFTQSFSMMYDAANPILVARALKCSSIDLFFSLMYGTYSSDSNRVFVAEVDFVTVKITYRRFLQPSSNIYFGVIYDFDKFFILASEVFVSRSSTQSFSLQNSMAHGIIYSSTSSCQQNDIINYPVATLTSNPSAFTIINEPISFTTFSAAVASISSVNIDETVFEGKYASSCSISTTLGPDYYMNLASIQTVSTTVNYFVEEITKVVTITQFTAAKMSGVTDDPVYQYSLQSFAGPPGSVIINPLTGALTVDTNALGVGTHSVVLQGKLQDCQIITATFHLIGQQNTPPVYGGIASLYFPSIILAQEDSCIQPFPTIYDPDSGQIIQVELLNPPSFVEFTDILKSGIAIEPTLSNPPGIYTIQIDLYDGFENTTYSLEVHITPSPSPISPIMVTNQGPPFFTSPLSEITLKQDELTAFTLPSIIDPDGDKFIINVALGEAKLFAEYGNGSFIFDLSNLIKGGQYRIKIELKDDNVSPQTNIYYLEVNVKGGISSTQIMKIANLTLISLKLLKATREGQVRLYFTGAPYYSLPFLASALNETDFFLTLNGLSPLNFTFLYDKDKISNQGYIILQINFENAASISLYDDPLDFIQIQPKENISIEGASCNFSIPKSTLSSIDLPNQQTSSSIKLIQRMSDIASSVQIAMIPSSIVINFFIQAAINQIWNMLNDISLMMNLPLIAIAIPGIASPVMSLILQFIYLDLLQTDKWLVPKEDEGQGLNYYFEQQGFKSVNILFNLGSTLIYTFGLIGLYLIYLFSICLAKRFALYLEKRLFWGTTIRFIIQQFQPMLISALINMQYLEFSSMMKMGSSVYTITILVVLVIAVVAIALGNIGQGIKGQWVTITLAKWAILSVTLVYLRDYPSIQLLLLTTLLLLSQCLLLLSKPSPSPLENHLSLFNELMTSAYLYTLFTLTDFMGRNQVKEGCGIVLLGVVVGTIGVNIAKVLVQVGGNIKCKKKGVSKVVKMNPSDVTAVTENSINADVFVEQYPKLKVAKLAAIVSKQVKLSHKKVRY